MTVDSLITWAAIATIAVGVVTIVNNWALAIYNNRAQARRSATTDPAPDRSRAAAADTQLQPRPKRRFRFVPVWVMLIIGAGGLALSVAHPATDVNVQVLRVAGFVGGLVFAVLGAFIVLILDTLSEIIDVARLQHRGTTNTLARVIEVLRITTGTPEARPVNEEADRD